MDIVQDLIENYTIEAEEDYIGLWQIAGNLYAVGGIKSDNENKAKSLEVARGLIGRNVMPGYLIKTGGFDYWPGTTEQLLDRIAAEWPEKGIPYLGHNRCWFALKKTADEKAS